MYVTEDSHQKDGQTVTLSVAEGLDVTVLTYSKHHYLMTTADVAKGYGISQDTIHSHKHQNRDEIIEGIHFVKGVDIFGTLGDSVLGISKNRSNATSKQIYWTKAGVIRLGFFIKSERAKMFRDWAEKVVLAVSAPKVQLPKAVKRNHNRLSKDRLVEILALVALVEDKELRKGLVQKLMPDLNIPSLQLELPFGGKGGDVK